MKEFDEIIKTLSVSDNEITDSPYWLILDPRQNMCCEIGNLASQITGPFFSREDAEAHLLRRNYSYSKRAKVFCLSGYWSDKYKEAYRKIEKKVQK